MGIILAQVCAQVAVPEATAEAMSYYHSGNLLWVLNWVWALLVPLLFLVTGFSGKLARFAKVHAKNWYFSVFFYLLLFFGIYQLLSLPLEYYGDFLREHKFGLSTQTLGRWLSNYGKSTLVLFVTAAAFVWIFYLLLKKSPRRWWFYSAIVSVVITFLMTFIYPVWIDPLFNHFGPLKDKEMEKSILDLASKAGIQGGRVYEVDMSKDTKTTNAYVTGFGSTLRIVIWDTSLRSFSKEGLLFVMGHEMGHYVLGHQWLLMGYSSVLFLVMAYFTYRSANFLVNRYKKRWGFQHLYDIASFPLLFFLVNVFSLLSTPLTNCVSRYAERQADRFGLEITRNNEAAAQVFADLGRDNLAIPRPGWIYRMWQGSHPSLAERIEFCNSYCPWTTGQPLKYGAHFGDE